MGVIIVVVPRWLEDSANDGATSGATQSGDSALDDQTASTIVVGGTVYTLEEADAGAEKRR